MKKVLASLILLVYFTVSTGFVVSLHYCMDRFDSVQLGRSASMKCEKCGMHKNGGCCHDDVKVVKLQLAHIAANAQMPALEAPLCPVSELSLFQIPIFTTQAPVQAPTHGPPLGSPPAYLLNGVFRI
jgi:hypothetical protein